ncbi:MAG: hypothetical protein GY941_09950 [Planctomycetes bacterium]|nr:hypothetical protein [Planctomycetota bacterium]
MRNILIINFCLIFLFAIMHRLVIGLPVLSAAPLQDQIVVDSNNPSWLKRNQGGAFFMCGPGDPEGFLYRGKINPDGTRNGDQMTLINKLKNTGGNCIYLMAVRSHGGDGDSTENPFIDHDPAKGINVKVLDQWEQWFTEMDNNGIVIFFFFYDDGARIWKKRFWDFGDSVLDDSEKKFIGEIVNRFEHYKNLIWVVAEEYQEAFSARHVSNVAAEITKEDGHDHVIAVHKLDGLDFSEFSDNPNIDQFAIQYNVDSALALHDGMVKAWYSANGRYNLNMSEVAYGGIGSGAEARMKNWAIIMGGAYVMNNGMDIVHTSTDDLEDMGRIVTFMESTNFYEMSPHDELAYDGTLYVLALPGDSYIAYASELSGEIGLRNMIESVYRFKWFDVTNGNTVIQDNVYVSSGNKTWPRPAGIGNELAVYINRKR